MEDKFWKVSVWPFSKGLLDKLISEFRAKGEWFFFSPPGELLCLFEPDI